MNIFYHIRFLKLFIFFVLPIIIVSCQSFEKSKGIEQILIDIAGKEIIRKSNAIVIIPNAGCSGCISNTEYYMTKNIADKNILFIVTGEFSIKNLRMRFGSDILKQPNFYIDSLNKLQLPVTGLRSMYPAIILIRNGRIEQIEEVSPENDGLKKLDKYLADKNEQ